MTTTAHLAPPAQVGAKDDSCCEEYPGSFYSFDQEDNFRLYWQQLPEPRCVLTARLCESTNHLRSLSAQEINALAAWPDLEVMVVEADGSKRLPIKVHAGHEPPLFSSANLGIAVIGMKALGRMVSEGQVHRPELIRKLLQVKEEHQLTPADIACVAKSYLKKLPMSRRILVLSQAEAAEPAALASIAGNVRRCMRSLGQEVEVFCQFRSGLQLCP